MENKSLANKAVSIKGKQYVLVQDRILYFNEKYPDGSITTELLSKPEDTRVVVKATVRVATGIDSPNEYKTFTGHSQAVIGEGMVNKTAALENAETSAVGRALAMMGIGVIDSIASADEMRKATAPAPKAPNHKQQIKDLLGDLDAHPMSKEEYEDTVHGFTGLALTEENYPAIVEALYKQVAAEKAQS